MKSAGSKEEKTNSKPKKNSVTCNNDTNKNMDGIEDIKNVNASKRLSGSSFSVTSYTKKVTLPPGWCVVIFLHQSNYLELFSEAYLEPNQTSTMKLFCEKCSIVDF